MNFKNLIKISKEDAIRNMLDIVKPSDIGCRHYRLGKQTRVDFQTNRGTPPQGLLAYSY